MNSIVLDIETRPNLVYVWRTWEDNAIDTVEQWSILSFSVKELGTKKAFTFALPDVEGKEGRLLASLWGWLDEADIVIGHNLDYFDIPRINARFAFHGMKPPSTFKTVDTYKIAKSKFFFNSNKLDALAKHLGIGAKVETGGFSLWLGCMNNDPKAWKLMKKYNEHDVILTEQVYYKLRPWMSSHPNLAIDKPTACPKCGAIDAMQENGNRYNQTTMYKRYVCKLCGGSARGRLVEKIDKPLYVGI